MKIDILKDDYVFLKKLSKRTGKTMAQLFHQIFNMNYFRYKADKVAEETFGDRTVENLWKAAKAMRKLRR